jgi:formylglycine-generating enzyme required for sulfatase activity
MRVHLPRTTAVVPADPAAGTPGTAAGGSIRITAAQPPDLASSRTRAGRSKSPSGCRSLLPGGLPGRPSDRVERTAVIERALSEVDPAARAQLFDDLGRRQADPRPGVGLFGGLPDLLWRLVPAGSYWMGGDPLALRAWAGRSIDLSSDYWTAAYPVTIAQYQAFIDDGGYSAQWRMCWTDAGWAWRSRYNLGQGLEAPLGWASAPGGGPRISNHPVEVDWYEAYAYTQWLEKLRRAGKLSLPSTVPDGHVIRLPDEAEREWAARNPDGRFFPWGDDYRSGYANIDETSYYEKVGPHYLGRITAVGLYPLGCQSMLGLYDLSGNVSEWCLTIWDEQGYSAENDPERVGHRVVRGGHYHNGSRFARAASRSWGDPDPDDQYDPNHGFRLFIGPPVRSRRG